MKKMILMLTIMVAASAVNMTATATDRGRKNDRYEQRYDRPGNHNGGKEHDKWMKQQRKQERQQMKWERDQQRRINQMIAQVSRGARNVRAWQVDRNTFVVQFFRNGRWYTQRIYPFADRYDRVYEVDNYWRPQTAWLNFTINL